MLSQLLKDSRLGDSRPKDSRPKELPPSPERAFHCEVVRQRRKTLGLYVKHRKVEVRVPLRASQRDVEAFVSLNREWIEKRLETEAERNRLRLRVEHGATILYRARELTLEFREQRKERVLVEDRKLIIQGHKLTPARARLILERYLQTKAQDYIAPRARGLAKHLGVEHKISDIRFRKTKTKWGHCTSKGVLQYNWLIMLAPYSVIDYMITHEVCHLKHMDHSPRFWALVDSLCPNSDRYVAWLKEHEHRLYF